MKVSDCKKCDMYERRVWVQSYKPKTYHTIGFNHAYAWCKKLKQRCLKVKECECRG